MNRTLLFNILFAILCTVEGKRGIDGDLSWGTENTLDDEFEPTTDLNIIEYAPKESIEMLPDESVEEYGGHHPKDGSEVVETILEDSVGIQDTSIELDSSEHLGQIAVSTESPEASSEEREQISDQPLDSEDELRVKQRVKDLKGDNTTRVLEQQEPRTNNIEAKPKDNSNEKDLAAPKTNIETESRISKQEPIEQNLNQRSKGDNKRVQMTKHHPKYSSHKENKLALTDETIKRIKNGHQHNQHKPATKVISVSQNNSNEKISDSPKSEHKKTLNTHKGNIEAQKVDVNKQNVKEVQESVHPKRQNPKPTKMEKQESKKDIAKGDSKPKSPETDSPDIESPKPTELDQKKTVNAHSQLHPPLKEELNANGEGKSTSQTNIKHAQKSPKPKENPSETVHKPRNPLHVLSSLKPTPNPNSKPSIKSEEEKTQKMQPETRNQIINGKEFNPPIEQHLTMAERKKDTLNPAQEKQQTEVHPEQPKGDISSVIEELSNKSESAVIAVTLTLIISTILLTLVGVFYRKISIGRRRYVGHTLLETEDDLPLFSRDEYHDTGVGYDSWNDDRN